MSIATTNQRPKDLPARVVGGLLGIAAAGVGVEFPVEIIPVRPWHVLLLLALLVSLHAMLRNRTRPKLGTYILSIDFVIAVYVIGNLVLEFVNSAELGYRINVGPILDPVTWALGYAAARAAVSSRLQAVEFTRGLVTPVFFVLPLCVAQILDLGSINEWTTALVTSDGFATRVEEGSLLRAVGLVGHWTALGSYLVVIMAAALALLIDARQRENRVSRFALVAIFAASISLITTLTFAPMLIGATLVILLVGQTGFRLRIFVLMGIAGVVAYVLLGSFFEERVSQQTDGPIGRLSWVPEWVPNTLRYRMLIWITETVPMITERPMTGWGDGVYSKITESADPERTYPRLLEWLSPESQWLGAAMSSGVLGLLLLVALLVSALTLISRARHWASAGWLARPMWILFLATVVAASIAPMFTNKGLPLAAWPLVGVIAALGLADKRGAGEPVHPEQVSEPTATGPKLGRLGKKSDR